MQRNQCEKFGSGGGSATFWVSGSECAKICKSTDPDPKCKILNKKTVKKISLSDAKFEL